MQDAIITEIPWKTWTGEGSPECHCSDLVEVRYRSIQADEEPSKAWKYSWIHFGEEADIVAYRVVKPPKKPLTEGQKRGIAKRAVTRAEKAKSYSSMTTFADAIRDFRKPDLTTADKVHAKLQAEINRLLSQDTGA